MNIGSTFLQSAAAGSGVLIGSLFTLVLLVKMLKRKKRPFDQKELADALEVFLEKCRREEIYEHIEPVSKILESVKAGMSIYPSDKSPYRVETKTTLWIIDKGGEKTGVELGKKYIISLKSKQ